MCIWTSCDFCPGGSVRLTFVGSGSGVLLELHPNSRLDRQTTRRRKIFFMVAENSPSASPKGKLASYGVCVMSGRNRGTWQYWSNTASWPS